MGLFKKKRPLSTNELESSRNSIEPTLIHESTEELNWVFDPNHITHFVPTDFHNIQKIADTLTRFKKIMIDLTNLNQKDRQRTIDFLSGIMYGRDGSYKRVNDNVYQFIVK